MAPVYCNPPTLLLNHVSLKTRLCRSPCLPEAHGHPGLPFSLRAPWHISSHTSQPPPPKRSLCLTTRNTMSTRMNPPSQVPGTAHTLSRSPTSLLAITRYQQAHTPHPPHTRTFLQQLRQRPTISDSPLPVQISLRTDSLHAPRHRTAVGLVSALLFDMRRPQAR